MDSGKLRNVALIAHVDHGKTTLVDGLLALTGAIDRRRIDRSCVLDSNDLERERGITILAKNTVVHWRGVRINLIDTPGHADFGGEVERVLSMADGVLLLVDAFEGPMPQTRFVLSKALGQGLRPIVVVNKMDRPDARPEAVVDEVYDLFIDLGAAEDELDFPILFASGKEAWASPEREAPGDDLAPLLDAILEHVPAPADDPEGPLRFRVSSIDRSDFVGRIAIGRVHRGRIGRLMEVVHVRRSGQRRRTQVRGLLRFEGLERIECDAVAAGDVCAVYGIEDLDIGDSLTDPEVVEPLPPIAVDEPTISMLFRVNDSPFAGRDGSHLTSRRIEERLRREAERDVALRVERGPTPEAFVVSGRGLLHLGILCETMRREGYEFAVGKPEVVLKEEGGTRLEPIERLAVEVPEEAAGRVIEFLGTRRGELLTADPRGAWRHLLFSIPARGLVGARTRLLTLAQGRLVMHHVFERYEPWRGPIPGRTAGVIVSSATGKATAYALEALADRGVFFVEPGTAVYEGMIVGEHCRENDITVNVCRQKKATNVRKSTKEATTKLAPARRISLEEALEYVAADELVEITPQAVRLRKIHRNEKERRRLERIG